ncbi:MAG: hypothetical protein K8T20_10525 [Planctomycetes bacterium]|nr:hypothetical protein [Planctomycetota bacterium]
MKRLSWVFVAAMAVAAAADPDAEIGALAERLGSADPDVRQKALPDLEALADSSPERLLRLLEHTDPEVAAAVRSILEPRGIFPEPEKTQRCQSLFKLLSTTPPGAQGRRKLVEELLELGGPAVTRLAIELASEPNCQAMPAATRVIAAGVKTKLALQARNAGGAAFWWSPATRSIYAFEEPFGRRRAGGMGSSRFSCGTGGARESTETPEELVIRALTTLARVPAGAIFNIAEEDYVPARRVFYHVTTSSNSSPSSLPLEGVFSGRRVRVDPPNLDARPTAIVAALSESQAAGFKGRIIRNTAGRWALEVTALEEHAAPVSKGIYDPFWWVAEGEGGLVRGNGSLREDEAADEAWTKDEVRVIPLDKNLPEGTTRLWLGLDVTPGGAQLVPAPVDAR